MIKLKNRKEKRILEERRIKKYQFDIEEELKIYSYLWNQQKGEKATIDSAKQFDTYRQWKSYVENKYCECDKDELIEISRYLNQKLRDRNPERQYNGIVIPIIVALVVDKMYDLFLEITNIAETIPNPFISGCAVVITLAILLVISVPILSKFLLSFWQDELKTNLLTDYKEIVDEKINNTTRQGNEEKR